MPRLDEGRTRRRAGGVAVRLLASVLALGLTACGSDPQSHTNQPPRVAFYGSPVEGDSVNYVVDFTWIGWDDDGRVVRSEYAVDIPDTFTPEQIADPATPGIEWISTTGNHARIRFQVGADSAAVGAGTYASDRASAPHTFFVRAIDNDAAYSAVADRSFNAWTLLPETMIAGTRPSLYPLVYDMTVYGSLSLRWEARDPDGEPPDFRVASTEYKVIPVDNFDGITSLDDFVNRDPGGAYAWVPAPGDSAALTLTLPAPRSYLVALRSIDEAGGVESRFEIRRNVLRVLSASCEFTGLPSLAVWEGRYPSLVRTVFPMDGSLVDYQLLAGQCLDLQMSADAQASGGSILGFRWCVDAVEDPREEGTPAGCVPWGFVTRTGPICFPTPGVHTVTLAARSTLAACGGGVTAGTLQFSVLPRDFGRDVLYVDDVSDPATDAETDRRFLTALSQAGFATVDQFEAWGPGDADGVATAPTLAELSRYRLVFWAVRGTSNGLQVVNSALLQASSCAGRTLPAYVAAGGAVWISGETVFNPLKSAPGLRCGEGPAFLPDSGINFVSGDFVADFLHLPGGDFRTVDLAGSRTNGLLSARPTARALTEGFPPLEADSTTYAFAALGGLSFYAAMFQPTFQLEGGLDTLYTAGTAGVGSAFSHKPIAWRYADPGPTPRQGPVVITSFPLQKMKEGAPSQVVDGVTVQGSGLDGLVEVMAAWFRAHDATRAGMARPEFEPAGTHVRARYGGRAGLR